MQQAGVSTEIHLWMLGRLRLTAVFVCVQEAGVTTENYLRMLGRLGLTAQEYEEATLREWTMPEHMLAQRSPVSILADLLCSTTSG